MLNFKKSLALVLAAATAFTFAPVANLGVTAHAATQTQTHNLIADDLDDSKFVTQFPTDIKNVAAFGQSFGSLALALPVTVPAGHTYQVYEFQNVSDMHFSDASAAGELGTKTEGTNTKAPDFKSLTSVANQGKVTDTNGDGKLYFAFNLNSVTGGSFKLKDASQSSENSYADITVQVTNTNALTKASSVSAAQILEKGSTNLVVAPKTNGDNDGNSYALTLNTSADPYYLGVTLGSVTGWSGVQITADKAVGRSYSGGAAWVNPDDNSGSLNTSITGTGLSASTTVASLTGTEKSAFIVKTAHADLSQLYVDFYAGSTKLTTITLNYTVARSSHAIDWIKWDKDTYKASDVAGASSIGWDTTGADAYTLSTGATPAAYTHQMNPFDGKNATITVKSESDQVTFVSTDTKIVEVAADKDQPYVAKVTAKAAGTATINVFVGSTNNNKGKLYILPVQVAENGNDTIDAKDSANILGNEEANTINLDATDQTAAGAVKEDVVNFTSQGGLKFDKVSVGGDTSAVTVSQADGVVTVKSNKTKAQLSAPAAATITMTSKTEAGKKVMGVSKTITVIVWAKPAAQFTVDPVFLSLSDPTQNTKILKTNPDTFTNVSWSVVKNAATSTTLADDGSEAITLTNDIGQNGSNTQNTAKVIAKKFGTATVKALVSETATTRKTGKTTTVTVGAAQANKLAVDTTSLVMTVGDTKTVKAESSLKNAVVFTSADSSVASVTTGGAITAVKAGSTTVKVTSEGADPVIIPVVVVEKPVSPVAVTGLKVANKKGAKVSVKWDSQDSNISYRVYKKVGNGKWIAKNVTSNKATLSVKKGAKVTVKVKAFVKGTDGKTVWGPKATSKSFKTDKK